MLQEGAGDALYCPLPEARESESIKVGSTRAAPAASTRARLQNRALAGDERYVASGADGLASNVIAISRAWNDHDLERLRALLPADFYLDDRRRTGVGRLGGVAPYLASVAAVWDLSRDLRVEMLYIVGTAEHGTLYVCRWSGTNAEGGEFDAVYVCIGVLRDNETAGLEIYELDDIELARARFAELSAGRKV